MKPILYSFGTYNIYAYGFMMVVAFFVFLAYIYKNAEKADMEPNDALDLTIFVFISGILGSRIIYVLLNLNEYTGDWKTILQFQKGGLAWHGGLLGGLICIIIYTHLKKINLWKTLDLMFTAVPLGLAVGRIGCFLNGCCYGNPTNLPWAVTFPHHHNPIPVHPTQFYELILDIFLFAFLVYWWNKRKFNGENFLLSLSLYSVIRLIVEFFRNTSADQMINNLSLAQWTSIIIFIILSAITLYKRKSQPQKETPQKAHLQESPTKG